MGFVRLFELLFPPHRNFTPVPDDWPPDGSLRFIECGNVSWKAIPNTYRNYEFSPNEDAYDSRIAELGIEIMKRFCGSRQVLTKIKSVKEISPQPIQRIKRNSLFGRMVLIKPHLLHLRNLIERMIASLIFTFCRTHLRLQTRKTPPKRLLSGNTMCGLV